MEFHEIHSIFGIRSGPVLCLLLSACADFSPAPVDFTNQDAVQIGDVHSLDIRGTAVTSLPAEPPQLNGRQIELGRLLFWDPVLSGDRDVACATCHLPENGYSDGRSRSIGVGGLGQGLERVPGSLGEVQRNAQGLVNLAWNGINEFGVFNPDNAPMFWDNRVQSLAVQAIEPMLSELEMRGDNVSEDDILTELLFRLNSNAEYQQLFENAYGQSTITQTALTDALAIFQTSLTGNNSPFDRWMRGDIDAMTPRQVSGMQEFVIAGCSECHTGPMFSDFEPHVLGVGESTGLAVTDDGDGSFAFRTPSLRQLQFTAPYFHGGQFASLANVIDFYDEPDGSSNPAVASSIVDTDFLAIPEMDDGRGAIIMDFLETLNDGNFDRRKPDSVPSGLSVGGSL